MFTEHYDQLKHEALVAYPEEAVWLVVRGECRRVANVSPEPTKTFQVAKSTMIEAMIEGLDAVIHSHPDYPACPSEADMRGQIETAVPWGVIATDGQQCTPVTWFGDGVDRQPLIGRGFCHGVTDCYGLIRDYYQIEHGIVLPEYPRSWEWWLNGQNLYLDGVEAAGFVRIRPQDAREGDMWFAQLRSPVPNHGGIMAANGLALHHPSASLPVDPSRLSKRDPIGRWLPHITHWYRHKEMPQ